MKRKALTILLTGVLCISLLTACGTSQNNSQSEETATIESSEIETDTSAEEPETEKIKETETTEVETETPEAEESQAPAEETASTEEENTAAQAESKPTETKPEQPKQTEPTPHTHTWDNGTVQTQPTCTGEGSKVYKCTGCNETKSDKLSALGHDWAEHTETIDVPEQGHYETNTTYETVRYVRCEDCGSTFYDASSAKAHKEETGHNHTALGEEKIPHEEQIYIVDVPAGQTTITTYTCNRCGATK